MSLMCGCDTDWCPEPGDWGWSGGTNDYVTLQTSRRKRCCSCKELIDIGALTIEHPRARIPDTDIEVRIYGDDGEIPIASEWMCEGCSDLFLSLDAIGYCVNPFDNMRELVREHVAQKDGQ